MDFPINDCDYNYLYSELKKLKLFTCSHRAAITKDNKPPKSCLYGYTNKQLNPNYRVGHESHHIFTDYYETKLKFLYPEFQLVVDKIAKKYFPTDFYFNSVQINKNTNCKPHKDGKNIGYSIIIGLGDYEGGELCIEKEDNTEINNIYKKFLIFDGSKYTHYTNDFQGERYSLIFFNNFDFNYRIAIPSYKRPKVLLEKTIKYLTETDLDLTKVDLFLKNEEEAAEYFSGLPEKIKIHLHHQSGIGATRNYIQTHYHESNNKFIVSIDDDIEYISKKNKKIKKFNYLLNCFFGLTMKNNLNVWGIHPCTNDFFMKDNVTTNLKYIPAGFFGWIVDKNKYCIHTQYDHLEDYAFSCEAFLRDSGVVRFNNYSMKTTNFAEGGINETYGGKKYRLLATRKLCNEFFSQYGDMCRIVKKKNYFNIILNHHYKEKKIDF